MPTLDVSDLILDPDMCEELAILRRHEVVNEYGESVVDVASLSAYGVVNPGSQPNLVIMADGQELPNIISVHTQFRLVSAATGNQPDVIVWRGRSFKVMKTDDFSKYGAGFVHAECHAMEYLDSIT